MKIKSKDAGSVLKLLPAAILALALSLSEQDREVLAYLITRSIVITTSTTTTPSSSSTSTTIEHHHKKKCKKVQKDPIFQCGCFECYTRFWVRWDSSPNRELIHQAIEAFEDHLTRSESPKKNGRARKKDRLVGRRRRRCEVGISSVDVVSPVKEFETTTEISVVSGVLVAEVEEECGGDGKENGCDEGEVKKLIIGGGGDDDGVAGKLEMEAVTVQSPVSNHKGLAWKVLPDVVGIFNSRLWSLWSPNI